MGVYLCDAVMFLRALIYPIIFVCFRSTDLAVRNELSIKIDNTH